RIEPAHHAPPGFGGRSLVIALGGGIVEEAVRGAGIDITLMGYPGFAKCGLIGRPGLYQPRIQCPVLYQNCRLDLRHISQRRATPIEWYRRCKIGTQAHRQLVRHAATIAEAGHPYPARAVLAILEP